MSNANNPSDPEQWLDSTVRAIPERLDVDRRDFMKATGAAAVLGALGPSQAGAQEDGDQYYRKTRPTVFTEEERQNAFENIETYDWAAETRDDAVASGDAILEAWDLEDLWRLVPSQNIPRSYILTPWTSYVTTTDWSFDLIDDVGSVYATAPTFDWELTNTVEIDGEEREITIPTNDFAAYRESGRDDSGQFDPELADDSLLVNTKHPELGEDWGVDDGTGFVDTEGYLRDDGQPTWWNPVAWLNHWAVIYGMRRLCVELSNAYLYTGDEKYVTPAAVILDRIGDVYPDLNLRDMHENVEHAGADEFGWAAFYNSDGGTSQGKFVGSIWESYQIREMLRNYDKVFPGMDGDDELVSVLSSMAEEYPGIGDKSSVAAVRENTESGFVHEMLPAFRNAQIRGNFGSHQQTLAVSAVCADDPDGYTGDAIDYVFRPGTLLQPEDSPTGRWHTTGGDVLGFLVGSPQSGYMVDEQGYPNESSVHYNGVQQRSLESMADELDGYDAYAGADLYRNPKFKGAVDSQWQLTFGHYLPHIANTVGVGEPEAILPGHDYEMDADFALTGFDKYRKPELAQWAYMLNGLSTDGLERGIHHPNPIDIKEDVQAVVDEHGPVPDMGSNQQTAYGFTALRDGEYAVEGASTLRGVYQYYGRNTFGTGSAHTHHDTHNLGVYGYDLDLAPELGRQGSDWEDNDLSEWVESTIAHNTVTVDEENVTHQWVGYPRHFDDAERVRLMDVESRHAYPQTDEHRRTTAMINVDEETSYVVDFFRVDGGDDHRFSFHGMTSFDVATEGLDLEPQESGTYAGEDVEFTEGGPLSYLYDVERDDDPGAGFSVDWDVEDYWDVRDDDGSPVHLRLTMLNDDVDDVALATGRPTYQNRGQPRELRFALAHRTGEDLRTTFTSVIEPYEGERAVESVAAVPVDSEDEDADLEAVRAVKVELADGRVDYVISSTDRESDFVIDDELVFKGAFGVYAERDGEREFVYANDAKLLRTKGGGKPDIQHNQSRFEGVVEDFTKALSLENELEVTLTNDPRDVDLEEMVGQYVYVEPADPDPIPDGVQEDDRYDNEARDRRNGAFRIEGVERTDDGATIDLGEHTLIRRFSTNDPADGYSYSIEEGAEFVVPFGELLE